jgi:RNA polymerase sigma factor (sigma-70 family)
VRAAVLNVPATRSSPRPRARPALEAPPGDAVAQGLRRGDHATLDAFYRAWFDRAVSLVACLTRRDEAFCLDAVQDAFVRLVRRPPPAWVDSGDLLEAWFVRVLHGAALDRIRSESRRAARDRAAPPTLSAHREPADAAETLELVRRLEALIVELDAREHAILRARAVSGAGLAQVAAAVGLTIGAVQGRLRRIAAHLAAGADPGHDLHREDRP